MGVVVKYKSLNETAYEIIRDKILKGEFPLGSRLREDLLAEEISMSRTPVREAINRLLADGLIINRARKGLYLIQPEDREIEEYIDIRSSLEKLSVEKCIGNISAEQKETIFSNLQKFKAALDREDFETCNILDADFHMAIARIADNQKLLALLKELSAFFQLVRRTEKRTHPREKNEQTFKEHSRIVEAILAGDVDAACRAMTVNIETMRTNLHKNVEQNSDILPLPFYPRVSKVMLAMMGRRGEACLTPSIAARTSSRSDIVSIQMTSAPPAVSATACSAKPATASTTATHPAAPGSPRWDRCPRRPGLGPQPLLPPPGQSQPRPDSAQRTLVLQVVQPQPKAVAAEGVRQDDPRPASR